MWILSFCRKRSSKSSQMHSSTVAARDPLSRRQKTRTIGLCSLFVNQKSSSPYRLKIGGANRSGEQATVIMGLVCIGLVRLWRLMAAHCTLNMMEMFPRSLPALRFRFPAPEEIFETFAALLLFKQL